jgi:hypothetical protein
MDRETLFDLGLLQKFIGVRIVQIFAQYVLYYTHCQQNNVSKHLKKRIIGFQYYYVRMSLHTNTEKPLLLGTAASTGTSVRNIDTGKQHDNDTHWLHYVYLFSEMVL